MSTSNLSPKAAKELLELQTQLDRFSRIFKILETSDPEGAERSKHKVTSVKLEDLASVLSSMILELEEAVAAEPPVDTTPVVADSLPQTKKEKRRARRAERKARRAERRARKDKEGKGNDRARRREKKVDRKKDKADVTGARVESEKRYRDLMKLWEDYEFDNITNNFREHLDKGEKFLVDAQNFINFAVAFAPGIYIKEIEAVEELIERTQKFLAVARNLSHQVDRYAKIAQDVIYITSELPHKIEELKDGVVTEATRIFAAARNFIATADLTDEAIQLNVEKLKGYLVDGQKKLGKLENLVGTLIEDADGDNLPDWYNKLEAKYNELIGGTTDLIPGTKIDDKILIQITGLKKSVDKFIAAASDKVEALGLQEKLKNAEQWLGKLNEFTEAITGFVESIKEGDLANIYQDLKSFQNYIDSDKDILKGTNIDDKFKTKLQEYSEKARTWLMNKLTGGDRDKEADVRSILGSIDKIILSTGGVVDHSSKYEKDENKISVPEINDVSQKEIDEVLAKYGIRRKGASFEGVLSSMKDQADATKIKVGAKFQEAVKRGSKASAAFVDAKAEYDQAVTKHNDYFEATNSLAKRIINGLLSATGLAINSFVPGAAGVVSSVGAAMLGEFDAVNDQIDKKIPSEFSFIGDLAKAILPGVLPQWGSDRGVIEIEGKELLTGLNKLYVDGVSARYQEVVDLLNAVKAKSRGLGMNLRKLEQADEEYVKKEELAAIQKKVIILEMKWTGLRKNISEKYINLLYPPLNTQRAYENGKRYLYSVWLIRLPKKEIRIASVMIKQFEKCGIMSEAKATWDTGFWAEAGRGFFGFFGSDPFDYRGELNKMKAWAVKENDALSSVEAWAKVF